MRIATLTGALTLAALLAGCGSSGSTALSNPNAFVVSMRDGTMTGQYNSAGFNAEDVRKLLSSECNGGTIGGYGEKPSENGLVAFTATCANGMATTIGNVEFQRAGSEVVTETTTSDGSGNLVYGRGAVSL